ncbi:hypothetical protein NDU88_004194 [Pleurodeles waltl]|uniref:Uncharacterized protein n=1 Tax=Pleurodeles waltl TaxID=8319 RepID=A0AAV7WVV4_PLEWA|nr:hypothetical protein NDU88_004194 [Pleurodeles waltl]
MPGALLYFWWWTKIANIKLQRVHKYFVKQKQEARQCSVKCLWLTSKYATPRREKPYSSLHHSLAHAVVSEYLKRELWPYYGTDGGILELSTFTQTENTSMNQENNLHRVLRDGFRLIAPCTFLFMGFRIVDYMDMETALEVLNGKEHSRRLAWGRRGSRRVVMRITAEAVRLAGMKWPQGPTQDLTDRHAGA